MRAELTNALTNALHAVCLLLYFLGALRHRRLGHPGFTRPIVWFFLILFVLKVMGVYVHYLPHSAIVTVVWAMITLLLFVLNYLVIDVISGSYRLRVLTVALFVSCAVAFALSPRDFSFLALPTAVIALLAALYSRGLLRIGFLAVLVSNVFWIAARKITMWAIGGVVPEAYRYDNDVYHLLLIISTFLIYKALLGRPGEEKGESPVAGLVAAL